MKVKGIKQDLKYKIILLLSYIFTLKYRIFAKNKVKFGRNFVTNWRLNIKGPGEVTFGDNITAWAHKEWNNFFTFDKHAHIQIGNNCRLNGTTFQSKKNIYLGENCIVGSALLVDTDFHSTSPARVTNPNAEIKSEEIIVGNNVWICGQCAILKGVKIGNNAIIGFASVVTTDVAPNILVGGNPARFIKNV